MNKKQFCSVPDFMENRELWGFDWLEYVTAVPSPLVLVTGYKQNGTANATMQSWLTFTNEKGFYCIFGDVNKYSHMFEIVTKRKQIVINFPDKNCISKCMNTIKNNGYETDELIASGLSWSKAEKIDAPVVDECFLNLECETMWEKPIFEDGDRYVVCAKIVNVRLDLERFSNGAGRYGETGYLYNIHNPINPLTGESSGTKLGIITPVDFDF